MSEIAQLSKYLDNRGGNYNVMDYGAVGNDSADDRAAILAAIDAAFNAGGGTVTTSPGKIHRYSGRILLRPGVTLDFGKGAGTSSPNASRLVATSVTGGIDLVGGSHLIATLNTTLLTTFEGPMLDVNQTKSVEKFFGRNANHASFDVDMYCNRAAPNATGLRFYSNAAGGVSWVKGSATIGEFTNGVVIETDNDGYVNENWLDLIIYSSVVFLSGENNGSGEIAANRIRLTAQTDSFARAQRALQWDGKENIIELKVWDWETSRVDASAGGHPVEITGGGNDVYGLISRSTGSGGFVRNPVIDKALRTTGKNIIRLQSSRFREGANIVQNMPANSFEQTFCGDQDDSLSYATRRYTVTSGTFPESSPQTFTADADTDVITANGHGYANGTRVRVSSTGSLPGGLSAATMYYVIDATTDTFKVSTSSGGSAVNITTAGSGTHSVVENPVDATSLRRLFEPNEAGLSVTSSGNFFVKVDLGVAPGKIAGIGVSFTSTETNRPVSIRIEASTDDSTWTTIMEAGYENDPVPQHLFRLDQPGQYRYWRMTVVGGSRNITINRWWMVDLGFARLPGMFPHIYNPTMWGGIYLTKSATADGLFIDGNRVVRERLSAIADAAGGDEVAKINAILAALRSHGLIST